MILEILFTLASAASGTLIYKKMGGFDHIKARVTALLPEPEIEPSFSTPERVLPYSQKLIEDARHMGDILSTITRIMMQEENPLWNRYTSVAARFNLMLNSHHDEDAFLHLTQEKRKFFSVFIPQVLSSLDFNEYAKTRDKTRYMQVFQQIHDYCLEIVVYYEGYQLTKNDNKLFSIQQAIVASKDESLSAATPYLAPQPQLSIHSEPVLTLAYDKQASLDINYHESQFGIDIRIQPKKDVHPHTYTEQLVSYLDNHFKDEDAVNFIYTRDGKSIKSTHDLVTSSYNPRVQDFELTHYPVAYFFYPYLKHAGLDEHRLMDIVVVIHPHTQKIEFFPLNR